jgi:hypothetical protein
MAAKLPTRHKLPAFVTVNGTEYAVVVVSSLWTVSGRRESVGSMVHEPTGRININGRFNLAKPFATLAYALLRCHGLPDVIDRRTARATMERLLPMIAR